MNIAGKSVAKKLRDTGFANVETLAVTMHGRLRRRLVMRSLKQPREQYGAACGV
ncbi:MAG: hypothetical protein QW468_01535 [Candidatus Bathyarchaeia archaeon]